jgi:hypothetical protein
MNILGKTLSTLVHSSKRNEYNSSLMSSQSQAYRQGNGDYERADKRYFRAFR